MLNLAALSVVGTLGRGDQQPEHERRNRPNEAGAEPDDVLGVVGEMMVGQSAAKEYSEKYAAEDDGERDQGYFCRTHFPPSPQRSHWPKGQNAPAPFSQPPIRRRSAAARTLVTTAVSSFSTRAAAPALRPRPAPPEQGRNRDRDRRNPVP